MRIKAKIGVSMRHVHLTEETYKRLFGDTTMRVKNNVLQTGEFASTDQVSIKSKDEMIEKVRVMGPYRKYNQVEISRTDAYKLKINPPVRKSGDLANSESITIVGPMGEVTLENAVIIANRHLHVSEEDIQNYKIKDNQKVIAYVSNTEKPGSMEVSVKSIPPGVLELHIDCDDANAFLLKTGDEVEIEL